MKTEEFDGSPELVVSQYMERMQAFLFRLLADSPKAPCDLYINMLGCHPDAENVFRDACLAFLQIARPDAFGPEHCDKMVGLVSQSAYAHLFAMETAQAMFNHSKDLLNGEDFSVTLHSIGERYIGRSWRDGLPERFRCPDELARDRAELN